MTESQFLNRQMLRVIALSRSGVCLRDLLNEVGALKLESERGTEAERERLRELAVNIASMALLLVVPAGILRFCGEEQEREIRNHHPASRVGLLTSEPSEVPAPLSLSDAGAPEATFPDEGGMRA